MGRRVALFSSLALVVLSSFAAAQDGEEEQRARALLGLTTQLREAQRQEVVINAQTTQLQHYRANAMTLASKLSQREEVWPTTGLSREDLQARALARYVERDLALNLDAALGQLAPLDALRIRVHSLNDAVESLRSALVMEGVDTGQAAERSPRGTEPIIALPEGVYTQRQSDFRAFPDIDLAQDLKPLLLPVKQGDIRYGFGEEDPNDPARVYAKGVQLATSPGATVYAPFEGKIAYAAPYRSFGNLVVIEHEGEGATLVAGLHSFAISVGDWVRQGAPLGLMATQAATETSSAPRLYFEFRVNQQSVDPLALVGSMTNE